MEQHDKFLTFSHESLRTENMNCYDALQQF